MTLRAFVTVPVVVLLLGMTAVAQRPASAPAALTEAVVDVGQCARCGRRR